MFIKIIFNKIIVKNIVYIYHIRDKNLQYFIIAWYLYDNRLRLFLKRKKIAVIISSKNKSEQKPKFTFIISLHHNIVKFISCLIYLIDVVVII